MRILRTASERAEQLLAEHRDKLEVLAVALDREEVLDQRQIEQLIGPSAYASPGLCHSAAARAAAAKRRSRTTVTAQQWGGLPICQRNTTEGDVRSLPSRHAGSYARIQRRNC